METMADAAGTRFVRYHRQMNFSDRMYAVRIDVYRASGESVAHADHTYTHETWTVLAYATTDIHAGEWRVLLHAEPFKVLATASEVAREAHAHLEFTNACAE